MAKPSVEVLRGTLDLLILKSVSWGPTHGYAVARWIEQATDDVLRIEEGSLYPALHRLERQKLLHAFWREADGRRRKYYELTDAGLAELASRKSSWLGFAAGVNSVLGIGRANLASD